MLLFSPSLVTVLTFPVVGFHKGTKPLRRVTFLTVTESIDTVTIWTFAFLLHRHYTTTLDHIHCNTHQQYQVNCPHIMLKFLKIHLKKIKLYIWGTNICFNYKLWPIHRLSNNLWKTYISALLHFSSIILVIILLPL